MTGLELSESYFLRFGRPMIEEKFPGYRQRIAAGLVGDGSECFGFDDEISRDHDWGPAFCLWLTEEDYGKIGASLQGEVDRLPREFQGFEARRGSPWGGGRTGVFEIGRFYGRFLGVGHVPASLREWRAIPESHMAAATNGRVFTDPLGEFSAFRNQLKAFYPEDVRLKKIASRCMTMAQSGQYNYLRCIRRGEYVAAELAEAQFITDSISIVFLLNRQYMPFYKWAHRAMDGLPLIGESMYRLLLRIVTAHEVQPAETPSERKAGLMEEVCRAVIGELRRQGLSDSGSDFLLDHGPVVRDKIQDQGLRDIDVWVE
jgi:hypothetical protein